MTASESRTVTAHEIFNNIEIADKSEDLIESENETGESEHVSEGWVSEYNDVFTMLGLPSSVEFNDWDKYRIWEKSFPQLQYDWSKMELLQINEDDSAEIRNAKNTVLNLLEEKENYHLSELEDLYLGYKKDDICRILHMDHSELLQENLEAKAKQFNSPYPCDWFTGDEVLDFIESEYKPASTEISKKLDSDIAEIIRLIPHAIDYFADLWRTKEFNEKLRKIGKENGKKPIIHGLQKYKERQIITDLCRNCDRDLNELIVRNCLPEVDMEALLEVTLKEDYKKW